MPGRSRTLLAAYLRPFWRRATLLALLVLATIGLQLLNPQILRWFIDSARAGAELAELNRLALLFLCVVVLTQIVAIGAAWQSERLGWDATNRLREDLALHCLRLPQSFHHLHPPGELIQRVDGDVDALANFFTQFVIRIVGNSLLLLGVFVVLLLEDWRLGMLVAACILIGVPVLLRLRRVAVPAFKAHRASFADLSGFWEEHIAGAEDLRSLGALPYTMQRHFGLLAVHMHNARRGQVMSRVMQSCAEGLLALGTAAAIALGAYLLTQGTLTLGTLYLVLAYTAMVATNLLQITMQLDDFQKASGAVERIDELLEIPDPLGTPAGATLPDGPPRLSFDSVSFGYDSTVPVLHDVSFTLEPGAVLGLLGRTGSGKSTLARLVLRFYDPLNGAVRWSGVDLRTVSLAQLRGRLGVVTQEVQLFHATVRDNLTLFDTDIRTSRSGRRSAYWGWTPGSQRCRMGWTRCWPAGSGLSAGEAQLLAFTRVFLRDPALVILDEASSRLDPATEQLVGRAVERLLSGRTGDRDRPPAAHRRTRRSDRDPGARAHYRARSSPCVGRRPRFASVGAAANGAGRGGGMNVPEANWRMLRFNPLVFTLSVALQIFRFGLILVPGLVLRAVFDRLAVSSELDWTLWGLIALLVVLPLARIAALLGGVFVEATSYFVSAALMRSNVFERLLRRRDLQSLPAPAGEIVNRLDKDAGGLSTLLSMEASTLGGSVGAILSFVLLLSIDPVIAVVVATPLLLVSAMSGRLGRNMMAYQRHSRRAEGQVSAFLGEAFGAVQALQIAGAEQRATERLRRLNRDRRDATVAQRMYSFVLFDRFVSALGQLGLGIAVLLGGRAIRDGTFTVGDFALVTYLIPQIADFGFYVGGVLVFLRQARVALDGLVPLLAGAEPQTLLAPRPVPWHRVKTEAAAVVEPQLEPLALLSVRGLSYRYPNGAGIADIDFALPRGSFTVLTGRIGAGKTTAAAGAAGLLSPTTAARSAGTGSRSTIPPASSCRRAAPTLPRCRACSAKRCATISCSA